MCGIAGVFWSGAPKSRLLQAKWIARRGPDGHGVWHSVDGRVTLEHVRLAIIDTSEAGHQPMVSHDGRVIMAFNGEIYNFPSLRKELEANGEHFQGHSDSEVLLALFNRQGIDGLKRLNGIFAVAFWEQDTQRLWLIRDALGVKPLYFSPGPDGVAFCSEIKGLLRSGWTVPRVNPRAVLAHLAFLWAAGEETIVSGVLKVAPGEAICVRNGQVVERHRFSPERVQGDAGAMDDAHAVAAVADGVRTAVQRQMIADVPVGAFLSGGLDSSAVVAFAAREASDHRLQCFSIRIQSQDAAAEGFVDDLPYAQRVAAHLGVDLNVVEVGDEMIDRLPEMIYLLDEPTPDPAALNTLFISELARERGMKVLLSGTGGDDIFTGYRRHYALMQERWWSWLPGSARGAMAYAAAVLPQRPAALRRLAKAFRYADLSADARLMSYFQWLPGEEALHLLAPDFRGALGLGDLAAPMLRTLAEVPADASPLVRMLALERRHFLADHNLHYTDKMGMAAGVEIRVPLLDPELVQLSDRLSDTQRQRGKIGKWVFKRAMEPYLPRDVIYRPKTGFGVPLRRWLHGRLGKLVGELLSPESVRARGIFAPQAVADLLAADRAGRIDAAYTVLGMVCIELWCRQYVDGIFALD